MKVLFTVILSISTLTTFCQGLENPLWPKLTSSNTVPNDLLALRSAVIYSSDFTSEDLKKIQGTFQKTGIDAIGYFMADLVFAGKDVTGKVAGYLKKKRNLFLDFVREERKPDLIFIY